MNFNSKENGGKKAISSMYPNMKNVFIVPNHKKNRDSLENPSLMDEIV